MNIMIQYAAIVELLTFKILSIMKKRIIFTIISLMMLLPCVKMPAQTSGKFYLEPFIGGTVSPDKGINFGLAGGFMFDYGLTLDVKGGYRRFSGIETVQAGLGVAYEYPDFYLGTPVVGVGTSVLFGIPHFYNEKATFDPTVDYKIGYKFHVVPGRADIGVEYLGNMVFMMATDGTANIWGIVWEHSLCVVFRAYLTH